MPSQSYTVLNLEKGFLEDNKHMNRFHHLESPNHVGDKVKKYGGRGRGGQATLLLRLLRSPSPSPVAIFVVCCQLRFIGFLLQGRTVDEY